MILGDRVKQGLLLRNCSGLVSARLYYMPLSTVQGKHCCQVDDMYFNIPSFIYISTVLLRRYH
jgi:hypothetical protein